VLYVVDRVHAIIGAVIDILLWPGQGLSAGWDWIWAALLAGAGMTALWGKLQSRRRLQHGQDQSWAGLLEVWLFRHEPSAAARAQLRALRANLALLFWVLLPAVLTVVVSVPLLTHLQVRYGFSAFQEGDTLLLHVECRHADELRQLRIEWPGDAGQIEAVVHEPSTSTAVARLRAGTTGRHDLLISVGDVTTRVPISVGLTPEWVNGGGGLYEHLLYPGGPQLTQETGIWRISLGHVAVSWRFWMLFGCVSFLGAVATWGVPRAIVIFRHPRA
jgi:hypothetical protein